MQRSLAIKIVGVVSALAVAVTAGAVTLMQTGIGNGVNRNTILAVASPQPQATLPKPSVSLPPLPPLPSIPTREAESGDGRSQAPKLAGVGSSRQVSRNAISRDGAVALVLGEVSGSVLGVSDDQHSGTSCWAVEVLRTDGSIVVGYVAKDSGVLFDWAITQDAPGQPPSDNPVGKPDSGKPPQDDEHEDHDDEDEHEDHDDEDEHEDEEYGENDDD